MKFLTKKQVPETYSVPLGSPLQPWHENTKKFINHKRYIFTLGLAAFLAKFEFRAKIKQIFFLVFNIFGTGAIIWYCINYQNFIAYGLISFITMYYFKLLMIEIKKPYEKEGE